MLSSLQALNAAATAPASRSAAFQPKVKPRARKGAQEETTVPAQVSPAEQNDSIPANVPSTQESFVQGRTPFEPVSPVTPPPPPPPPRQQHVPKPTDKPSVYGPVPARPARERALKRPVVDNASPSTPSVEVGESSKRRRVPSCSTPRRKRVENVDEEIDPSRMTMKEIIRLAEAKERKKQKEDAAKKLEEQQTGAAVESKEKEHAMPFAPQVEIVDGKLVINQQSMQVDARALNTDDVGTYRRVEEGSSKLNYHSYMKKVPRDRWKAEETERFYKAVQQFGTDFAVIERLFPGKSRAQIKAKFKKEERCNSRRLTHTLLKPSRGDTTHYEELVNKLMAEAAEKAGEDDYNFTWDVNADRTNEEGTQQSGEEVQVDEDYNNEEYANGDGSVLETGAYEEEMEDPAYNTMGDESSPKKEESPRQEAQQQAVSSETAEPKTDEKKAFPLFAFQMENAW